MIYLNNEFIEDARDWAVSRASFMCDKYCFSDVTDAKKLEHSFRGRLAENVFKSWLLMNDVEFVHNPSKPGEIDEYDFLIEGKKIDVKCVKYSHPYLIDKKEVYTNRPKDFYVAVALNEANTGGEVLGWVDHVDLGKKEMTFGFVLDVCFPLKCLNSIDSLMGVLKPLELWEL